MSGLRRTHTGRFSQIIIYLGKFFRIFIYQNDWKVLPMAAVIAGLVAYVVGANIFKTMEGTLMGSFALACICIWNGFFNSIQVICRERAIIKREHRSGMHVSAYIAAHMIHQAAICVLQVVITLLVFKGIGAAFPKEGLITPFPLLDMGISLFLITYCADMLALLVSAVVHSTTAAMTVMPFLLIVQLIFSGGFFSLSGPAVKLTNFTVAKWGLTAICSQGNYNSLPMVALWNSVMQMKDLEVEGRKPVYEVMLFLEQNDLRDEILQQSGENNQKPEYEYSRGNVLKCWGFLVLYSGIYVILATVALEFIDKDKR